MLEVIGNMSALICMVCCFIVIFSQQKKITILKHEIATKDATIQKLRDYLKRLV